MSKLLKRHHSHTHPELMLEAMRYYFGDELPREMSRAFKLCRKAYKLKHPGAARFLGTFYDNGFIVKKDDQRAMELYREAVASGHCFAYYNIGRLLYIQQKYDEAIFELKKGALQREKNCFHYLGYCYRDRDRELADWTQVVEYYELGAELKDGLAMVELAYCYHDGTGVLQNESRAVELLIQACELDYSEAYYLRGIWKHGEDDTIENLFQNQEAMELIETAARMGDVTAQTVCGEVYAMKTDPEFDKAIAYLRLAMQFEEPRAKYIYAILQARGDGMEQNCIKAARLCREAADAGEADAQHMLGLLYEQGNGVWKSRRKARRWFQLAADNGNERSKAKLAEQFQVS